jgi:hypothetical protein
MIRPDRAVGSSPLAATLDVGTEVVAGGEGTGRVTEVISTRSA